MTCWNKKSSRSTRSGNALLVALGVLLAVASVFVTRPGAGVGAATSPTVPPTAPPPGDGSGVLPAPVVSYTMEARLDVDEHRVGGSGEIVWRNTSDAPQRELYLHLYLNGFKNERTVFLRSEAGSGFRGSGRPSQWGYITIKRLDVPAWGASLWPPRPAHSPGDPEDETDIRVPLPREVAPGEQITLEVEWLSQLPSVVLRTGFSGRFHMVAQWFPKVARLESDGTWAHFPFHRFSEFYADYGDYDVWIDVPKGYVVGATGRRVESQEGERRRLHYVQRGVHDFAFTAWDRFEEQTTTVRGIDVRVLYPPGRQDAATLELDAVRNALPYFESAFGSYPYETLTLMHPPPEAGEAGGMEYPTFITTGGTWWHDDLGLRTHELVTVHELGHQWFYGLVGSNEYRWPFLDEGVNSYAELRAMEAWKPGSSLFGGLGFEVSRLAVGRAAAAHVAHNDEVAQAASDFGSGEDYGGLVYARTSTLLWTIGRVWGDVELEAAVGDYARRGRFGHPTPDVLIDAVRGRLGAEAAAQLRAGLFERAWVDYSVAALWSGESERPDGIYGDPDKPTAAPASPDSAWVGGARIRRRGTLEFPVAIALHGSDGTVQHATWDGRGRYHVVPYGGNSRLVAVVVDPELRIAIDDDLTNNARRTKRSAFAPNVQARGTALFSLLWSVMSP